MTIILSVTKKQFKTFFKPAIQLGKVKNYEIPLANLETYYSFQNVDKSNNSQQFYIEFSAGNFTIALLSTHELNESL